MSTENEIEIERGRSPQQFRIIEILCLIVCIAVVLAVSMPYVRTLPPKVFQGLIIFVALEVCLSSAIVAFASWRRKRMLDICGDFIGSGNSGESQNQKLSHVSSAFMVVYFLGMEAVGAVVAATIYAVSSNGSVAMSLLGYILPLQFLIMPNLQLMMGIRYVRWGLHVSTVEFYSRGVSVMDILTPWERTEVRRSQLHSNRLAIVVTPVFKDDGKSTLMVWVDESLADKIIAMRTMSPS